VYVWTIKKLVFVAATEDTTAQLRIGLSLKPRNKSENKYDGYYITSFLHISDKTAFRYIPFLDALGVSGRDFTSRTIIDENGNISKIGAWRNSGDFEIAGQLQDNDPDYASKNPKKVGWLGEAPESDSSEDDEEDDFDDEEDDFTEDEEDEFEEEETTIRKPARNRRRTTKNGQVPTRRRGTTRRK
jgi:hypothetical protein